MELISGLIGIGVGVFGTWLTYRNRISPQREILYSKQSEIYSRVLIKTSELYNFAIRYLNSSDTVRKQVQNQINEHFIDVVNETADIGGISPTGVYLAYTDLISLIAKATNPKNSDYGTVSQSDLVKASYQFYNSIRRSMGVDSLTEESMGLYRKPTDTREYLSHELYHPELNNPNIDEPS